MTSHIEEFSQWARSRQVGCLFARAMFKAPEEYGIRYVVIDGAKPAKQASLIARAVELAIADPEVEGVVCIIPSVSKPEQFSAIFDRLAREAGWIERSERAEHSGTSYRVVGLDVPVGEDQGLAVLAEVVAFAPFEYLPVTRRAPVAAIALRSKPFLSDEPLDDRHERRANLAAIKFEVPAQTFSVLWQKSQELRRELDGDANPLARARVALAFPDDRKDLG